MTGPTLPACSVQYPSCGACGSDTSHDGDGFYCDPCGLDYGAGEDGTVATYRNPDTPPCGHTCTNEWHGSRVLGPYECTPCQLPQDHAADHWTDCRPIPKETR